MSNDIVQQVREAFTEGGRCDLDEIDARPALALNDGWKQAYAAYVALKEIERLKRALKTVGDDYPGSSCQQWCYEQAGLPLNEGAQRNG